MKFWGQCLCKRLIITAAVFIFLLILLIFLVLLILIFVLIFFVFLVLVFLVLIFLVLVLVLLLLLILILLLVFVFWCYDLGQKLTTHSSLFLYLLVGQPFIPRFLWLLLYLKITSCICIIMNLLSYASYTQPQCAN